MRPETALITITITGDSVVLSVGEGGGGALKEIERIQVYAKKDRGEKKAAMMVRGNGRTTENERAETG
jgi:hypothetical protein